MSERFTVGVLGAEPVGVGIAVLLARAGYSVVVGTRYPGGESVSVLPSSVVIAQLVAAADCSLVVLAVMHSEARDLVVAQSDRLAGKVLIDVESEWLPDSYRDTGLSQELTEGRWMSQLLPRTRVVRAFSHIDWDLLVPSATNEPGRWAVAYSADDADAGSTVAALIFDMGYVPVRVGNLDAGELDAGGVLWPGMFTPEQMRAALRRPSEEERITRRGAVHDG
jgi:predicted dinucleotide-binding enzyme